MFTSTDIVAGIQRGTGLKFVVIGILAGYSDASILHYIRRRFDRTYETSRDHPEDAFTGTGLVRCPQEMALPAETILADIQANRIIPIPFPDGSEYLSHWKNTLKHVNDPRMIERYNILYPKVIAFLE